MNINACLIFCVLIPITRSIRDCNHSLGLESGQIKDNQLSSSSSFDEESTGPQNARIRTEVGGGAWCPRQQINSTVHEWIQVSFPAEVIITSVETQGRFDEGRGVEYPHAFMVEYWRNSLGIWQRYKDSNGNEVVPGNTDTKTAVLHLLESPIIVNLVRIIPVSEFTRTVCLRFELYGCSNRPIINEGLETLADGNILTYISIDNEERYENQNFKCIVIGIAAASSFGILSLAVLIYLLLCTRQIRNRKSQTTKFNNVHFGASCQKEMKMSIQNDVAKRYVTPPIPFAQNRYYSGFHNTHHPSSSISTASSSEYTYAEPECESLVEPLIKVCSVERSTPFRPGDDTVYYASSPVISSAEECYQPLSSFERFAQMDRKLICEVPVVEFNQKILTPAEKIGSGNFGDLHVCTLDHSRYVLVRYAKEDGGRIGFGREKRVLSQLNHQNVLSFFGVVNNNNKLGSVFEFPVNGDLPNWMRKQSEISHEQLLSIATQMAAGMAYFESLGFVHRDLAARNCLVDAEGTIKIADIAVCNPAYADEYHHMINANSNVSQLLPIRWMACEMNIFTSQSDAWSLAVTIWEVFDLCRRKPYHQLEDSEVIQNLDHLNNTGQLEHQLECPESCPAEIYNEILTKCWVKEPSLRPTNADIHRRLQNMHCFCPFETHQNGESRLS